MTRYLIFLFLGLPLSFFILITTPDNSKIVDALGLITLAIGTGLYLKKIKLAGLLSSIGLSIVLHVVGAWWYNLIVNYEQGIDNTSIISIYVIITVIFMLLLVLSLASAISIKKTVNKLDKIFIQRRKLLTLSILPLCLIAIEIFYCFKYMQ